MHIIGEKEKAKGRYMMRLREKKRRWKTDWMMKARERER